MKHLCIFCGSSKGNDPVYEETAEELAKIIVDEDLTMVYGGGSIGIMGVLADKILSMNGKVIGVIPRFLYDLEVGHDNVTELIIVESMHERKQKMAEISDGFLALPGGFGTLEEMGEILTWIQLKLIRKPIGLLNINGFYDEFLRMLDKMVESGFLKKNNREILLSSKSPEEIITIIKNAPVFEDTKWIEKT
jgi:uncharacterized protein (TIGR00730 family)